MLRKPVPWGDGWRRSNALRPELCAECLGNATHVVTFVSSRHTPRPQARPGVFWRLSSSSAFRRIVNVVRYGTKFPTGSTNNPLAYVIQSGQGGRRAAEQESLMTSKQSRVRMVRKRQEPPNAGQEEGLLHATGALRVLYPLRSAGFCPAVGSPSGRFSRSGWPGQGSSTSRSVSGALWAFPLSTRFLATVANRPVGVAYDEPSVHCVDQG
ncbi:n-acetyl-gamma-glutamyl-phosphate reductase [Anopheles sinensis]|uniref:N-acetyl-gamma-glutamyl-phosphate reductase n=1 Tax=Anopheles sinensis TaxID=74873 RepID=A0A084W882_ANOSI|nr:n-acetyl-gamma-glutamyl-phosphate reductase [Anopheles sinensis]